MYEEGYVPWYIEETLDQLSSVLDECRYVLSTPEHEEM